MSNYALDALQGPDILLVTLFREAAKTWEQMDSLRQEKINLLFSDASEIKQLPSLIHPSLIRAETVWQFAYKSSLAAQAKTWTDKDEPEKPPLKLRNVEAARQADLATILIKAQKKPVGMFLSALGRNADGSRDTDTEADYYPPEDQQEGV